MPLLASPCGRDGLSGSSYDEFPDISFHLRSAATPEEVKGRTGCHLHTRRKRSLIFTFFVLLTFDEIFSPPVSEAVYLLILSVRMWDWNATRRGWLPVLTDASVCGRPIGRRTNAI